jgi:superfamily II DNA or RNA helicase
MGLRDYSFKPDYNKIDDDIADDFYLPAMKNSIQYDRISGYFGSTIYIIAWTALQEFIEHGGKMRIVCSPVISDPDKTAMAEGYSAKNDVFIQRGLAEELNDMFQSSELDKPTRVLACLIAENILDIKIAVPESGMEPDLKRLFHDKVGIFTDRKGDSVGFRGSMNETYQGLSEDGNLESIDVFPSWDDRRDSFRVDSAKGYFERLWNDEQPHALVYNFPDALKQKLIDKCNGYDWKSLLAEISTEISLTKKWRSDKKSKKKSPREHQIKALENWVKQNRRGILEHATGSGKTYTAICAIRDALNRGQTVLVLVPSKELLRQWEKEILENISDISLSILLCGDGNTSWREGDTLSLWTRKGKRQNKITIAIMDTACSDLFVHKVSAGEQLLLVADEVHRIGSPERRNILNINAGERLGLSATPIRYGDPEGTSAVFNYFGGIVPPVFSLQDAIRSGVLTKYYYHPLPVYLTAEEQDEWNKLTSKINKMIVIEKSRGSSFSSMIQENTKLKMQLIARARILKQAKAKVPLALDTIKKHYENEQRWIIYCDNQRQLSEVLMLLLKNGYDAYEYHSSMGGSREETLKYFSYNGGILVSIKCLDEGVDIPETTHALILASSKNPREFIQRRGRILRRAEGKYFAQLYDAIVMPQESYQESDKSSSIIEAELSRAIQFGEWAENPSCTADLKIIARKYGIDYQKIKDGGYEDDREEES